MQQHSTLETLPDTGMQVRPDRSVPEVYYAPSHHPPYPEYKGYDLGLPNIEPQEKRIAGFRRVTFWLLVALFAVVALALGLSTGLGLGLRKDNSGDTTGAYAGGASASDGTSSTSSTTSSITAESTPTNTATKTSSSSSSTTSSTITVASPTPTYLEDSGCPNVNGTTVTKPSRAGTHSYRVYCESDLTGSDQASLVVNSLGECITLCDSLNWTQKRGDIGAVWNEKGVVEQTAGTCWCKGGNNVQATAKAGVVVASAIPS
ncbi:hypothetical protein M426DRAFT_317463 [Hypoxylon sp. CI-4A]|nr:hypothetical protein M426DRAFT_317463 [Hypoxylon sp. CI-4A]